MKIEENKSLKQYNTFGIDVSARYFVTLSDLCDFDELKSLQLDRHRGLFVLGGGSNIVFTKDYDGVVLHPENSEIKATDGLDGDVHVEAGAGMKWVDFVRLCVQNEWHGVENMAYIPGTVGAAPVQNVGAYGVEAKDIILCVWMVEIQTGKTWMIGNEECEYSYRQSRFKKDWRNRFLITRVTYGLSKSFHPHLDYGNIRSELERKGISEPTARQLRDTVIEIRNAKLPDPKVMGNAGSFFMKPVITRSRYEKLAARYPDMPHYRVDSRHEKIPAGWMIDQCGWKGKSLGRAGVHDKQAMVLVNRGGATGQEIVALSEAIQSDVKERFGIEIHPEVNIV